jgi:S-DNA-T family DNA segregation ATPase FtsK/SpoIIIE
MMKKYHVVSRSAHVITVCLYSVCITFPLLCVRFVLSLIDGKVFNDTGLLHPDDDYPQAHEWIAKYPSAEVFNFVVALLPQRISGHKRAVISYVVFHAFEKNSKKIADNLQQHLDCLLTQEVPTKKNFSTITKQSPSYALPHMNIFIAEKHADEYHCVEKELQDRAHILQDKLERFGVHGSVVAIKRGPVVTLFEYQPDIDTKLSKIIVLEDDLAMALQAMSIRIIAPIPGRSVVGFEVANTLRHDVLFSQIINQPAYAQFSGSLPLVLGKGTIGQAVVVDLARMPHLLIAGSTGSGKSVALNAILISLLCKLNPDDLKLILIDPKRLEFAAFTDIAHLLFPIITSSHQAAPVLRWVVQEMEDRYEKMSQFGARNISDYNSRIFQSNSFDDACKPLPFIVVVIDELADLMITAGRDIEDLITRITQMARAAGIHMIVATQRPSVDVITGLIKANFPSRISFRVASRIDSRTILDTMGADRLLGRGDMLFLDAATSQLQRVHGAYVSDQEIERVADHIRAQRKVEYLDVHQITSIHEQDGLATDDVLYKDIRLFLDKTDEISISLLQRKFRIGYNRSARIIELLESQGLIMPQDGSKTRKVIR